MTKRMVFEVTVDIADRHSETTAQAILDEKLRRWTMVDDLADDFDFVESSFIGIEKKKPDAKI